MSKMNEYSQRARETQQEYIWKFMEHLYEMIPQPILMESDIIKMESDLNQRPLSHSKRIISNHPLNNTTYNPQQGIKL